MGKDRYTRRAQRRARKLAEKRKFYFEKEVRKEMALQRKERLAREAKLSEEQGHDRTYLRTLDIEEQPL